MSIKSIPSTIPILQIVAAPIVGLFDLITSEPWSNWNWLPILAAILLTATAALKLFEYEKWLALSLQKIFRYTQHRHE